ncbi:MAG: glycoside hydrolase family 88 protein, partial [Prevotella sp.]|nr:glycoside hydrolase family 88 protein [Prevotella sp.]
MSIKQNITFLILLFAGVSVSSGKTILESEKADVKSSMKSVADWQIRNFKCAVSGNLHDYGVDAWTNATLYIGMFEWAKIADDSTYYHWLKNI